MLTTRAAHICTLLAVGIVLLMAGGWPLLAEGAAHPKGQIVLAVDFSLAPTWFDPAETPAMGTPYVFLYALHDALIKPLPGNAMAPCRGGREVQLRAVQRRQRQYLAGEGQGGRGGGAPSGALPFYRALA